MMLSSILATSLWQNAIVAPANYNSFSDPQKIEFESDSIRAIALEPWTYFDDFEDRDLGAWASYPMWQDIAYNQNFRVNEIIPGDPNISIVQKVTPYTAVDNYAGAQKLLDMFLVPGSTISFRYFLKSNQPCAWFKLRFAAGDLGKLDFTINDLKLNQWSWITVNYDDILRQNPIISVDDKIKIYALAFLAQFPNADPDMPIYLGLDDIGFKGARPAAFQFIEPDMYKLPEFAPYIPKLHYYPESTFHLSGKWVAEVQKVSLEITPFANKDVTIFQGTLSKSGETWNLNSLQLDFPEGLYFGKLKAYDLAYQIAETTFTLHIAPKNMAGQHPRLLFNSEEKKEIETRFTQDRFQKIYGDIRENAKQLRIKIPVESLHFDLDQFPDEIWLPSWDSWGSRIYHTGNALRQNARAYAFHGDQEAGEYVKQILLVLSAWPNWTHPWQTKRGRFSEHRTGDWSHRLAESYDLIYHLMSEDERTQVRQAIMKTLSLEFTSLISIMITSLRLRPIGWQ
ncbi:MAG: hypothetical protein IPL46_20785 [Saprospiraceae bacterium]|nr:hypothetical protein [Saprospiraceae bacterium]